MDGIQNTWRQRVCLFHCNRRRRKERFLSSNFKGKSSNKFPLLATAEERWKVGLERIIEKFKIVTVKKTRNNN